MIHACALPVFPSPSHAQYPGYMPFAYDAASTVPDAATAAAAAEAAAVAAGYPTQEMYLANKEWYNSQGYYGLTPAGTPAPAPAGAAAPAATASAGDPGRGQV